MATRAPLGGRGVRAGGPAEPTTTEKLAEVERRLLANKPWPACLLVGSDALDEWENCPDGAKEALEWMATSTVGLLDIASVGPLTPICQSFKALIEAVGGAAKAEEKLRGLISWCAFIIGVFIKLGKEGGALSDIPVDTCLRDFETTASRLATRAKKLASRRKLSALLHHGKDTAQIADFEQKLRQIWVDIGVLATLDTRGIQRGLLPPKLEPMADVPIEAPLLPDSHVERGFAEGVISALLASGAGSPPHMLHGMGGGGKTVLASSVVRHEDVRKHFRQGIFWIRVGQGGKDQLHALFQGLARGVAAAPTDTPHGTPSDGFGSLAAVVQHLTAVSRTGLPRLLVLDDVWEREVVDTVLPTGLVLLVTTRDETMVTVPGRTRTNVGDMTEGEAVMLLKRASGTVGSPGADVQAAMEQVGRDCGFLPLALAIAGSMPVVKGHGSSTQEWKQLHTNLKNRRGMLLAKGGTNTSIHHVLDASFDVLGTRKQNLFLKMAVLPKGVVAPEDMLLNLWEFEDVQETRDEARGLIGRSLLQVVGRGRYRVHDLLLDFARGRIRPVLLESAAKRQAQYLGRHDVLWGYARQGEHMEGFYALMSLWRSVEDLSHNPRLQVEEYHSSLQELAEDESTYVGEVCWAVGRLFELQAKHAEAEPLYIRCMEIMKNNSGPDHPSTAISLNNLAGLLWVQGKYVEAESLYLRAIGIYEKVLGPNHLELATTLHNLARLFRDQGNYAEAELLYVRALGMREKVLGEDHGHVATTLNDLALLLQNQGKYAESEVHHLRAISIKEKVPGPDCPEMAIYLSNLADLYRLQNTLIVITMPPSPAGKVRGSEPLYLRAIGIREKVLGSNHLELAATLHNLAGLFLAQGNYAEAEPLYVRALRMRDKVLGEDHGQVATTLNNLAMLLQNQKKYAEAEALYLRAIGIREKVLGPNHANLATTLHNLAGLFQDQGNYAEAEPLYVRALGICEREDHGDVASKLNGLALLLSTQGKYAESEVHYLRAISITEKVLGPDRPEMATLLYNLARLFQKQGKHAEAEPLFRRALGIDEKALGADHLDVALTLNNLAVVLHAQGKHDEAIQTFERALTIETQKLGEEHADTVDTRQALERARRQVGQAK